MATRRQRSPARGQQRQEDLAVALRPAAGGGGIQRASSPGAARTFNTFAPLSGLAASLARIQRSKEPERELAAKSAAESYYLLRPGETSDERLERVKTRVAQITQDPDVSPAQFTSYVTALQAAQGRELGRRVAAELNSSVDELLSIESEPGVLKAADPNQLAQLVDTKIDALADKFNDYPSLQAVAGAQAFQARVDYVRATKGEQIKELVRAKAFSVGQELLRTGAADAFHRLLSFEGDIPANELKALQEHATNAGYRGVDARSSRQTIVEGLIRGAFEVASEGDYESALETLEALSSGLVLGNTKVNAKGSDTRKLLDEALRKLEQQQESESDSAAAKLQRAEQVNQFEAMKYVRQLYRKFGNPEDKESYVSNDEARKTAGEASINSDTELTEDQKELYAERWRDYALKRDNNISKDTSVDWINEFSALVQEQEWAAAESHLDRGIESGLVARQHQEQYEDQLSNARDRGVQTAKFKDTIDRETLRYSGILAPGRFERGNEGTQRELQRITDWFREQVTAITNDPEHTDAQIVVLLGNLGTKTADMAQEVENARRAKFTEFEQALLDRAALHQSSADQLALATGPDGFLTTEEAKPLFASDRQTAIDSAALFSGDLGLINSEYDKRTRPPVGDPHGDVEIARGFIPSSLEDQLDYLGILMDPQDMDEDAKFALTNAVAFQIGENFREQKRQVMAEFRRRWEPEFEALKRDPTAFATRHERATEIFSEVVSESTRIKPAAPEKEFAFTEKRDFHEWLGNSGATNSEYYTEQLEPGAIDADPEALQKVENWYTGRSSFGPSGYARNLALYDWLSQQQDGSSVEASRRIFGALASTGLPVAWLDSEDANFQPVDLAVSQRGTGTLNASGKAFPLLKGVEPETADLARRAAALGVSPKMKNLTLADVLPANVNSLVLDTRHITGERNMYESLVKYHDNFPERWDALVRKLSVVQDMKVVRSRIIRLERTAAERAADREGTEEFKSRFLEAKQQFNEDNFYAAMAANIERLY